MVVLDDKSEDHQSHSDPSSDDKYDFTNVHSDLFDMLSSVRSMFHKCIVRKSPGPDMITGTFLKVCADQLRDLFY